MSQQSVPYTTLASFLKAKFGCRVHKITVDAGLTCPNRDGTVGTGGCIYCNERGSGTGVAETQSITEQLESAKGFLKKRYKAEKFIAYFQSFTNTYAPVERLSALYNEALAVDDIVGMAVGTRPDCVNDDVLDLLASCDEKAWVTVEYGLQSGHDRTLETIKRGHDVAAFVDAVRRTRVRNIDVTAHVILGLPGETRADMLETARLVASLDIQGVKIHLLYVVRNTPLHDIYERGEYHCLTRGEYADITSDFIALLPTEMIIHRVTGDPHRNELVAPDWALEKSRNLEAIRTAMHDKGLVQGSNFTPR